MQYITLVLLYYHVIVCSWLWFHLYLNSKRTLHQTSVCVDILLKLRVKLVAPRKWTDDRQVVVRTLDILLASSRQTLLLKRLIEYITELHGPEAPTACGMRYSPGWPSWPRVSSSLEPRRYRSTSSPTEERWADCSPPARPPGCLTGSTVYHQTSVHALLNILQYKTVCDDETFVFAGEETSPGPVPVVSDGEGQEGVWEGRVPSIQGNVWLPMVPAGPHPKRVWKLMLFSSFFRDLKTFNENGKMSLQKCVV